MHKRFLQILTYFFIAIFALQIVAAFFLVLQPAIAGAAPTQLQVAIDGQTSVRGIAEYISLVYKYGTGVVGIVAAVVLMFGGILWLTAGGNTGQVQTAKEWIKAALLGLILALLSYMILLTINPDLVSFDEITIKSIEGIPNEGADKKEDANSDESNPIDNPDLPESPPEEAPQQSDDDLQVRIPGLNDDDPRYQNFSEEDLLDPVTDEGNLGNN
ncbi:MAG: hypothetical protein ABIH48_02160 [Candidatus Falkowbacteria bacterium]